MILKNTQNTSDQQPPPKESQKPKNKTNKITIKIKTKQNN